MRIHISHLLFCAITIWFLTLESNSRSFCKYILMCKHAFVEVKWVKSSKITELSYLEFLPSPSRALSEGGGGIMALTHLNNGQNLQICRRSWRDKRVKAFYHQRTATCGRSVNGKLKSILKQKVFFSKTCIYNFFQSSYSSFTSFMSHSTNFWLIQITERAAISPKVAILDKI